MALLAESQIALALWDRQMPTNDAKGYNYEFTWQLDPITCQRVKALVDALRGLSVWSNPRIMKGLALK